MSDPFPFDPRYTGITLAYSNRRFIADRVLPRVSTGGGEKFKYYIWTKEEGYTLPDTKVGRKSAPNQIEFTAAEQTGRTLDFGLDDLIPSADVANAPDGIDPVARAVLGLTHVIALGREKRVADLVFNAANYAAANKVTLSGGNQWDVTATSTPIADIRTGLDAAFVRPNKMTIGRGAWTSLSQHPDIVTAAAFATKSAGVVRPEQVADLFELDEVLIGEARLNTAAPGQTASYSRVWGKHCLLHWTDEAVRASEDNFVTFGFSAEAGGRVAGSMPEPKKGLRGGELVRVGESLKEVISAADVGYLITDASA